MFNPFDTNAHVWRPIFNPFNFLHDVYASEDVDFGSSYDLIGKNKNHPATKCFQAFRIFINKELTAREEGCLSIPGYYGKVSWSRNVS